ncbi:MAG: polyprenyl synthetase family protein, partial [Clostridia bacterium]|nr:polyprenyl synthetase family protein [Clostridia bacterium]
MDFGRVFAHIGPELEEVRRRVTHELRPQGAAYMALVEQELATSASRLHPALVILSARFFHYHPRPVLALACVLQFIYLATRIHFFPGERPALPVLLGDLLYSKFFSYLCRYHCLEFLAPLAEVICRIHEGGAMRQAGANWHYPECLGLVDREAALLLREACRAGARVASAPPDRVEALADYGFNLGRGWGLL